MSPDPLTGPLCTVRQDCQPVVSQSATDENFVLLVQWWDFNVVVQDDAPKMLLRWNTSNCSGLMLTDRWEKTTTHQQDGLGTQELHKALSTTLKWIVQRHYIALTWKVTPKCQKWTKNKVNKTTIIGMVELVELGVNNMTKRQGRSI